MKNLIIVESPAKAKTIKGFLGKNYEVIASKGHIRDLPKTNFGIKIEDGKFIPQYRVSKDHSDIVKKLKESAKKSETIYIATDEDREGEAIGYHIATVINKNPEKLPRIVFHEITKTAIKKAIENPRHINFDLVNAQQARRMLDRIVGYKLSPLLNSKIQKGLSAGRVQSATLKLIVDREREIKEFNPQEYYTIHGFFKKTEGLLTKYKNEKIEKFSIKTNQQAQQITDDIKNNPNFKVTKIETKKRNVTPPAPFMTSTLQQNASSNIGFSPRKTMQIAQKLYEGVKTPNGVTGIITYMRTDSLNIAKEAQQAAIKKIEELFSKEYVQPREYKTKSLSQEAHEAIRPTMIDFTPQIAQDYLSNDELKLYTLIYNRFLASQMANAVFETQGILIENDIASFKLNGRKLVFDGFYRLGQNNEKDKLLPEFKEKEQLSIEEVKFIQHFTEPPPRYNEASLVKKMESLGIGRPSTYAPTISLLQNRNYIEINNKQIIPTKIAFTVIEILEKYFPNIVDSNFTAKLEKELDEIASHKKDWQEVLREFYEPFIKQIEEGKKNIPSQKIAKPIDEYCPKCGSQLVIRKGRFGEFIACSAYPKCKYTKAINEEAPKTTDIKCDKCGSDMIVKSGKNGEFLACSNYPECKNTKPLKEPEKLDVKCPECGGNIIKRKSRRGDFYGCENYPKCTFISKYKPTDKKCPECNYMMAERTYRNKEIYECIKCKTKIPKED